ncbi:MAG: pyruvate flavodoxin/ferredoxin oxidoreductase [Deltaproteobacteria bacterium]|nr:pyruvate flavodoxin/ferredoxin oxidoreductase [Deltaproteobacteria bacterium]
MPIYFMDGNEAVARGAIASGCRFFAGYPITPASPLFNHMFSMLPVSGGVCVQGEDEIASIGFCLGASMAGLKAMTATSGPGISLYSENISFAIGSEIPIVIIDVQRLGPSSGSATRTADGDIQFLRWGNTGGLPVIVLSPVDAGDCFQLTMHAFNLAEEFRCPVFVASNKDTAQTREYVALDEIERPKIKDRHPPPPGEPFSLFRVPPHGQVPYFLPIGDKTLVRQTSSTHGENGYITTDPCEIAEIRDRMNEKIVSRIDDFSFYEFHERTGSDTLVIVYGSTARSAKEIFEQNSEAEKGFSLLILKTLWPVPERVIEEKCKDKERIIVIEMNLGQYVREIQRIRHDKKIEFFGQMNGELITPEQIKKVIGYA